MPQRIHVVMPDDLIEQIDQTRGDVSRSAFMRRALQYALKYPRRIDHRYGYHETIEIGLDESEHSQW